MLDEYNQSQKILSVFLNEIFVQSYQALAWFCYATSDIFSQSATFIKFSKYAQIYAIQNKHKRRKLFS